MAADDSAKKRQGSGSTEGTSWSALREQIRRASSAPPSGPGMTPDPSGVRPRPATEQRRSAPAPRVFGKTLPPPSPKQKTAEAADPAVARTTIPERPVSRQEPVETKNKASAKQQVSEPTTSAQTAPEPPKLPAEPELQRTTPQAPEAAETSARPRLETPRERRATAPRRPRRFESKVGYGVLPSLKANSTAASGRDTVREPSAGQKATSAKSVSQPAAQPSPVVDRSRADTPRQRAIPRIARRAPDQGDNTPVSSPIGARRRSSVPPVARSGRPAAEQNRLPSVVVDPSLTQDAAAHSASAEQQGPSQGLPSVVVDSTLRHEVNASKANTRSSAAVANASTDHLITQARKLHRESQDLALGSWDRRRDVATKAALVAGALFVGILLYWLR